MPLTCEIAMKGSFCVVTVPQKVDSPAAVLDMILQVQPEGGTRTVFDLSSLKRSRIPDIGTLVSTLVAGFVDKGQAVGVALPDKSMVTEAERSYNAISSTSGRNYPFCAYTGQQLTYAINQLR